MYWYFFEDVLYGSIRRTRSIVYIVLIDTRLSRTVQIDTENPIYQRYRYALVYPDYPDRVQRKHFQKLPVDQPENPVDQAGGPVLPNNAPQEIRFWDSVTLPLQVRFSERTTRNAPYFLAET